MEYEWDDKKNEINLAKHDVDFTAAADFDWSTAIEMADSRSDYGEERFIASGYIGDRLHILVYTPRNNRIRLIGLRRANAREIKRHEQKA